MTMSCISSFIRARRPCSTAPLAGRAGSTLLSNCTGNPDYLTSTGFRCARSSQIVASKNASSCRPVINQQVRPDTKAQLSLILQVNREIQLHSVLKHENIIDFYAAFEDTDNVYLVQEYAHGERLLLPGLLIQLLQQACLQLLQSCMCC